jgi:hypothetical protein
MSVFDLSVLTASATLAVPVWEVGAAVAVIVVLCGLAIFRSKFGRPTVTFVALSFVLATIASAVFVFQQSAKAERAAERRSLATRAAALTAQTLLPGSALGCLEGDVGEAVEAACERALFARPEAVASAVAYTGARLLLLADGLDYASRADPAFAETLAGARRAIELDRYGIAAQILATRDGCTADKCPFFALLSDAGTLKANLKVRAFATYVARYTANWATEDKAPPVADKPAQPAVSPQASAPAAGAPAPVASKYNFPSSASIPAVSIMNAEPPLPAEAKGKTDPAAAPGEQPSGPAAKLPVPPKRPQSQAAAPPPH